MPDDGLDHVLLVSVLRHLGVDAEVAELTNGWAVGRVIVRGARFEWTCCLALAFVRIGMNKCLCVRTGRELSFALSRRGRDLVLNAFICTPPLLASVDDLDAHSAHTARSADAPRLACT